MLEMSVKKCTWQGYPFSCFVCALLDNLCCCEHILSTVINQYILLPLMLKFLQCRFAVGTNTKHLLSLICLSWSSSWLLQ